MSSKNLEQLSTHSIGGGWGQEVPDSKHTEKVAIIRGTDIPRIAYGDVSSVPYRWETSSKIKSRLLQAGDIVMEVSGGSAASGQHTGRALHITKDILERLGGAVIPASFCRLLRLDRSQIDARYFCFEIAGMHLSGEIAEYENQSTGIANFQFTRFLSDVTPKITAINEQKDIAETLGALDDRITLLRETNKTLEAITQAIFKSWFIDFDPVRAKMEGRVPVGLDETTAALFPDQLVESELGLVPKGWAPSTVGEVCTYLNRGISPKYAETDGILVLNQKCIRDFQIDFSKGRRHDSNQRKVDGRLLEVGDILVNSTGVGTLGRVAQILGLNAPAIVDSHVTVVRASETITWTYLGEYMKKMQPTIESMGEGSTGQTELSRSKLADLKILTPSQNVTQLFDSIVKPLKKRIFTNQESAFTLSHLRDTLLPRLVSGRLGLSKFEEGIL